MDILGLPRLQQRRGVGLRHVEHRVSGVVRAHGHLAVAPRGAFETTLEVGPSDQVHAIGRPDDDLLGDFCRGGRLLGHESQVDIAIPFEGERVGFTFDDAWIERDEDGGPALGVYGTSEWPWDALPEGLMPWARQTYVESGSRMEPTVLSASLFGVFRSDDKPPPRLVVDVIVESEEVNQALDDGLWIELDDGE